MCGIVGYVGKKNIDEVLISGLENLEYRGYDSSGIAKFTKEGNIQIVKSTGRINNLEEKLSTLSLNNLNIGIGHTRWATHGIPNEINAHPHKNGSVTLVHNGIIENYTELKQYLENIGVKFSSDTDTEVACAYINYMYIQEKDKIKCIKKACETFKGSYAFAIIFDDDIENIYATRYNSPLIIGKSEQENYISSDISAFLNYTKKYILLNHNEYAKVSKDNITIYDDNLNVIENEVKTADWDITKYEKNGYDHFMLKEIYEQPEVIQRIYDRYLSDTKFLKDIDLLKYTNIHIVACGSAYHVGYIGKYLIETYLNIPVTVEIASEYRYKNQIITESTLCIFISQSGETADTLAALKVAKEHNAYTISIVNAIGSTIARESDKVIYTNAGPEIAVATTKGYTSQVAILSALVFESCRNNLSKEDTNNILQEMQTIQKTIEYTLSKIEEYEKIAKSIYVNNNIFFIGRGIDYAMCMEGSLKLKEISYIQAEAYPAGELKHGTISLIEDNTPVIVVATDKKIYEKTISNVKETKARGSFVIYITTNELDVNDDFYDIKLVLPSSSNFNQTFTVAISLQLISYYTAKLKNCDIDKPRNLAKSVTVE